MARAARPLPGAASRKAVRTDMSPHPTLSPGLCPVLGSSRSTMEPSGLIIISTDAAAFGVQREKEPALGSLQSSVQEQVLWGYPWLPNIAPVPS